MGCGIIVLDVNFGAVFIRLAIGLVIGVVQVLGRRQVILGHVGNDQVTRADLRNGHLWPGRCDIGLADEV